MQYHCKNLVPALSVSFVLSSFFYFNVCFSEQQKISLTNDVKISLSSKEHFIC
ncbi:unnamed protein product, partial [marine sediment metagenome]